MFILMCLMLSAAWRCCGLKLFLHFKRQNEGLRDVFRWSFTEVRVLLMPWFTGLEVYWHLPFEGGRQYKQTSSCQCSSQAIKFTSVFCFVLFCFVVFTVFIFLFLWKLFLRAVGICFPNSLTFLLLFTVIYEIVVLFPVWLLCLECVNQWMTEQQNCSVQWSILCSIPWIWNIFISCFLSLDVCSPEVK